MQASNNKEPHDNGNSRRLGKSDYTSDEKDILRRHVVKMAMGKLEDSGDFSTSRAVVEKLFTVHLPAALKTAKAKKRPLRILFWAHGGLVSEKDALRHVLDYGRTWEDAGIYPVYFVWKTGIMDALASLLSGGTRGGWFSDTVTDPMLEAATRLPACAVWGEMKAFAEAACTPAGGASFAINCFSEFHKQNAGQIECYACGHSAGSIFHSHCLPLLAAKGIPVHELFLLAPAVTISLFSEKLAPLIGESKSIRRCSMFTMHEEEERRDHVIHLYRKSLLYFVSRACEPGREEPILGLVECLRTDSQTRVFWGLDNDLPSSAELVLSRTNTSNGPRATNSIAHGDFDNDPDTLNSLARRITGDNTIAPFDTSNTPRSLDSRGFGDSFSGPSESASPPPDLTGVTIYLRQGSIHQVSAPKGIPAIHYRAAGHYEGAEPMGPEWYLDQWVSETSESSEHIIAGLTRRGTMPGGLGQTTIIPHSSGQCASILGLGRFGSLGPAELTTAVRELCLTLSRMKGRHLATVLIGGGAGNMSMDSAITAWLRGIAQARAAGAASLKTVTFVEYHNERYLQFEEALSRAMSNFGNASPKINDAEYQRAAKNAEQDALSSAVLQIQRFQEDRNSRLGRKTSSNKSSKEKRVTVKLGNKPLPRTAQSTEPCHISIRGTEACLHFTAMTKDAAVPERTIGTDPKLIEEISSMIASATEREVLREWGKTLQQLVIPRDLHTLLFSSAAPLVLTLDAKMARIPWEMLTLPGTSLSGSTDLSASLEDFLGLASDYGVTRQLQTTFAPAPERERSRQNRLSVLIVADPAPDASLPGARREALWLRDFLKESFPDAVVELLDGPMANRANLARELCNRTYDILHFAGHCHYNKENPAKSGWIFRASPLEVFSADELMRLDRVPSFIFSNACESGVTPDRVHLTNLAMGPAFAEAFFAKGVGNFLCTGWPVNDRAALDFAKEFYTSTLKNGLTIREATQNARRKAAATSFQTAGAYQHYGSPSARLFETPPPSRSKPTTNNPRPQS